jgi:predicted Zn-dependent protease with MMP-like domain
MAVGDFNRDNQLDLVITSQSENNIGIYLGYGNGSFDNGTIYSTGDGSSPQFVSIGDFNSDNILDIVVANNDSNSIGIFMGYGDGTFTEQIPFSLPNNSFPSWVAVADFNNDNILDIPVCNQGLDNVGIFFGYGNGSFNDIITINTGEGSQPYSIDTGDLNNDTWIDIAVACVTGDIGIFFGYGNGTFSSQTIYSTGSPSPWNQIIIADLNSDTKLDVAVSNFGDGNGNIGVLYGYGDGHFAVLKIYSTGWNSNPISIAVGDFNNDNQLDLAVSQSNLDSINIMLRLRSEPFATPTMFSTGNNSRPQSVVTGDFNNDDQLDIAVANSATNNIGMFLGYGNGNFAPQQTYFIGNNSRPVSLAVGDFNNDHHLDIAVANSEACTIVILRGFGNGSVAVFTTYSTGALSIPSSIAVDDLNSDHHLDIVVTNYYSDELLVFLGFGNGTFFEAKSYSLGYNTRPQSVAIGDMNNDGLLDIIVANYGGDYVQIFLQTC